MQRRMNPRTWMWISLVVGCLGLAYDFIWHGLFNPRFEAATVEQMVRHLGTVHLPLYIGVVGMLLSSAWALINQLRFLTAPSGRVLDAVLESYGQDRTPSRDERGRPTGRIRHVLKVFLLDREGFVRNVYSAGFPGARAGAQRHSHGTWHALAV